MDHEIAVVCDQVITLLRRFSDSDDPKVAGLHTREYGGKSDQTGEVYFFRRVSDAGMFEKGTWSVTLNYEKGEPHDILGWYKTIHSTAYKIKPPKFHRDIPFRLKNVKSEGDDVSTKLRQTHAALMEIEQAASSLQAWCASRRGMVVKCRGEGSSVLFRCNHTATLSSRHLATLAERFSSLEQIQKKLRCRRCGAYSEPTLTPARKM